MKLHLICGFDWVVLDYSGPLIVTEVLITSADRDGYQKWTKEWNRQSKHVRIAPILPMCMSSEWILAHLCKMFK